MFAPLVAVALLAFSGDPPAGPSVVLCEADGTGIRTEVLRPDSSPNGASIVYVHGGNWLDDEGLKQQFGLDDPVSPASRAELSVLVSHGYVVFVPHYRGSPRFQFPTHIVDLKCAMRALRTRAAELRIDPDRIGVMGASAGGHLAALLGLAGTSAGWDRGADTTVSSRPQAVAAVSAPVDLTGRIPPLAISLLNTVFGSADPTSEALRRASPATYVSKDAPPFLLVHGDADPIVPYQSSQALHDALRAAGAQASFILVRHAGHELRPAPGYATTDPPADELTRRLITFFDQALMPAGARATIDRANADWLPAILRKDAEAIVQPYSEDALFVTATGDVAKGRDAILKLMRARLARPVSVIGGELKQDGIALAGPLIYEWGHASVRLSDGSSGSGRYLTVWARGPSGQWRISRNLSLP